MKIKKLISKAGTLVIVISTFFIMCSIGWTATYYVDATNGNDGNSGISLSTSWKTIAKVNASNFNPGDQILFKRGEIWREQLTVPSSGSAGNPITFGAYGSGNAPIINGSDLVSSWQNYTSTIYKASLSNQPQLVHMNNVKLTQGSNENSLNNNQWYWTGNYLYLRDDAGSPSNVETSQRDYGIYISGKNYITINGLETDKTGKTANAGYGIGIQGSSYIAVSNCVATQNNQNGILAGYGSSNITINSCTTHDNYMAGVSLYDGLVTAAISNLTSYNNTENGILLQNSVSTYGGISSVRISNSLIYSNGNEGVDSAGISGATISATFYACASYGNGTVNPETNGHGIAIGSYSGFTISYCLLYNNLSHGVYIAFGSAGNSVLNSTFYNNGGRAIGIAGNNNTLKNNIMTESGYGSEIRINSELSGVIVDYNLYYKASGTKWDLNGTDYSSLSSWQTASGQDGHSIASNPLFTSAAANDLHLQIGSPAIDAGTDVSLTTDYDGTAVPQGFGVDMGAYEYRKIISPPGNLQILHF
jgi:hypothetical protein